MTKIETPEKLDAGSNADLAAAIKAWRQGKLRQHEAAEILGIPKRTLENAEQGRGFPYPKLLAAALKVIKPEYA